MPCGGVSLGNFYEIGSVCSAFRDALAVKIWMDLLKGLRSYRGFKLRGSSFPHIFSSPLRQNYTSEPRLFSRFKNVLEVLYHLA